MLYDMLWDIMDPRCIFLVRLSRCLDVVSLLALPTTVVTPAVVTSSQLHNLPSLPPVHPMEEGRLKKLKVAQLREILDHAGVAIQGKPNKLDLIKEILRNKLPTPQSSESATLPDGVDDLRFTSVAASPLLPTLPQINSTATNVDKSTASKESPTTQLSSLPASNLDTDVPAPPGVGKVGSQSVVESEQEKRKRRAERFGIPLVELPPPATKATGFLDDPEKMKKRAERFGLSDEMARRAKRAKRFQTLPKGLEP